MITLLNIDYDDDDNSSTSKCINYKPQPCSSLLSSQSVIPSQRLTHSWLVKHMVNWLLLSHVQLRSSDKSGQSNSALHRRLVSTQGRPWQA